jgi:L-serine dehydratase
MEAISVFDMLKIGIGPSSSHTMGPWLAASRFVDELKESKRMGQVGSIKVHLYGSLALTGKGHGTDIAILMGLAGEDPETVALDLIDSLPAKINHQKKIALDKKWVIRFDPGEDLSFHYADVLPLHPNGMVFNALTGTGDSIHTQTYYSIGGGFVIKENPPFEKDTVKLPYPIFHGKDLLKHCESKSCRIVDIVWENEKMWQDEANIKARLNQIWEVMKWSVFRGCHTSGHLPGGLQVQRRAAPICAKILGSDIHVLPDSWIERIHSTHLNFAQVLKLVGAFAMAVNEENAGFGRVVTAPTNGASGVIPAVLMYYLCFTGNAISTRNIHHFLMVAGEMGSIFKKGSTISAAMGGCQAEIGVSSAMAAAALTELLGGHPAQSLMAAEIAMEHHLGLTCDPVGGLVQIPCIERNSMGAIKAITAANLALDSDPDQAKISLDAVIKSMWETAMDMNTKYKETSQGGLAAQINLAVPEC